MAYRTRRWTGSPPTRSRPSVGAVFTFPRPNLGCRGALLRLYI
jgi:hypothetical protein